MTMMSDQPLTPMSLRLPESIAAQIKKRATANRRSLNSELIVILERALEAEANTKQGEAA